MAKKSKSPKTPSTKKLVKEQPTKTDLSFDELLKLAINTPIKSSKSIKK